MRRDHGERTTLDQPIALKTFERLGEHALADAADLPPDGAEAERTGLQGDERQDAPT